MNQEEKKKKLEEIINQLEKSDTSSESWKNIIEKNKEEFQNLKSNIRIKQNELKDLVINKRVGKISQKEFEEQLEKLQNELTDLEFKVYNLRLNKTRIVKDE
ncbi:MAG: hypothetical protein ACTSPY_17095 [Candidatus Helarchaeota archaeon]